jgi:hypothetical protein
MGWIGPSAAGRRRARRALLVGSISPALRRILVIITPSGLLPHRYWLEAARQIVATLVKRGTASLNSNREALRALVSVSA